MARLDGASKELYPGERDAMLRTIEEKHGVRRKSDFCITEVREVERRVASGHKVTYVSRGFFRDR